MTTPASLLSSPLSEALGWALLHSLWQGAAVLVLLGAALALLRGRSPNARYLAATAAMGLMLVAPVVTFVAHAVGTRPMAPAEPRAVTVAAPMHATGTPGRPGPEIDRSGGPAPGPTAIDAFVGPVPSAPARPEPVAARVIVALRSGLPWLAAAWCVGVVAVGLWHLGGWVAAQRMKSVGVRPAPEAMRAAARRLAGRLGVTRPVRLLHSTVVRTPVVLGWLRPAVLLPAAVASGLTPAQVEAIIAHELAHVRRHDYLVNLLQCAVETLLFYHPAVWWVSAVVREEREHCCDDAVLAIGVEPLAYAESLVRVLEAAAGPGGGGVPAVALAASGRPSQLRRRLMRMLPPAGEPRERPGGSGRWVGALTALAVLGIVCLTQVDTGARAADEPPAKEPAAGVADDGGSEAPSTSGPASDGPATAATPGAEPQPDTSTPRAAALALHASFVRSDVRGALALMVFEPQDKVALGTRLKADMAAARLVDAAAKAFGESRIRLRFDAVPTRAETRKQIERLKEVYEKDGTARLVEEGGRPALTARKTGQGWRIEPEGPSLKLDLTDLRWAAATNLTAAEIEAGTFRTAQEADAAFARRLAAVDDMFGDLSFADEPLHGVTAPAAGEEPRKPAAQDKPRKGEHAEPGPAPEGPRDAAAAADWVFAWTGGAVVEAAGPDRTFDFEIDRGRLEGQERRDDAWMDEHGVDLSFDGGTGGAASAGFVRHRTAVIPVEPEAWERMSPDEVLRRTRDAQPDSGHVAVDWQKLPLAYLVKTRAGQAGLIRLRRIVEPDRASQKGYWVEHKLVVTPDSPSARPGQQPPPATQPKAAADAGPPLNETERRLVGQWGGGGMFPAVFKFSGDRQFEVSGLGETVARGRWHARDHRDLELTVEEGEGPGWAVGSVQVRHIQQLDESSLVVNVVEHGKAKGQFGYRRVGQENAAAPAGDVDARGPARRPAAKDEPANRAGHDDGDGGAKAGAPEPRAEAMRVLLVTEGNFWLEKYLRSDRAIEVIPVAPADLARNAGPDEYAAVIFDRHRPDKPPARSHALSFGVIPPGSDLRAPAVLSKGVSVKGWKRDHPVMQGLDVSRLHVGEALKLEVPDGTGWEVLVDGSDGPLIVAREAAGRREVVVAFDVNESTWPLNPSFPTFLHQCLAWLAGGGEPGAEPEEAPAGDGGKADEPVRGPGAGRDPRAAAATADELKRRLAHAERELLRMEQLRKSGAGSVSEYERATIARDTAAAELNGDAVGVARLKLRRATLELEVAERLRKDGAGSVSEYETAKFARDTAAAELNGDAVEVARLKFRRTEIELARADKLLKAGAGSRAEYDAAKAEHESAQAAYERARLAGRAAARVTDRPQRVTVRSIAREADADGTFHFRISRPVPVRLAYAWYAVAPDGRVRHLGNGLWVGEEERAGSLEFKGSVRAGGGNVVLDNGLSRTDDPIPAIAGTKATHHGVDGVPSASRAIGQDVTLGEAYRLLLTVNLVRDGRTVNTVCLAARTAAPDATLDEQMGDLPRPTADDAAADAADADANDDQADEAPAGRGADGPAAAAAAAPTLSLQELALAELARTHGLEVGQAFRVVNPPFAEARAEWVKLGDPSSARSGSAGPLFFAWRDGKLRHVGGASGDVTLADVVHGAMGLPWYQFEGLDKIGWPRVRGDIVVREDAAPEDKLKALAAWIKAETGQTFRVTGQARKRPCVVLRGQTTSPGYPYVNADGRGGFAAFVTAEPLGDDELARRAEKLTRWGEMGRPENTGKFGKDGLSSQLGAPVLADPDDGQFWRTDLFLIADDVAAWRPADDGYDDKLRRALDNLRKQLGGDWQIEQRVQMTFTLTPERSPPTP